MSSQQSMAMHGPQCRWGPLGLICAASIVAPFAIAQTRDLVREVSYEFEAGTLHMVVAPFDSTVHPIVRRVDGVFPGSVATIDGYPVFGTDPPFGLPRTVLISAELEVDGRRIPLETTGMFNPWFGDPEPTLYGVGPHWRADIAVRAAFSDAAGAYAAEWLIFRDRSERTILSDDEAVVFSLLEYIERDRRGN